MWLQMGEQGVWLLGRGRDVFNLLIWKGVFWAVSVDFYGFGSISNIFGPSFSHFRHFSESETWYTRTEEATMYYSPSENTFKAGQLGPIAYRIWKVCPGCGFSVKPHACLTKIVLEYFGEVLGGLNVLTVLAVFLPRLLLACSVPRIDLAHPTSSAGITKLIGQEV
jgi:hypothetical protein